MFLFLSLAVAAAQFSYLFFFSVPQHNSIQRGKRPMSFLMPTAVRPALGVCGTYLAVGSSNADKALSAITQVL